MDQKTIVDGLLKALANGSGTLDNLDELLDRAKNDIATAKQEEIEAQKKAAAEKEAQAKAQARGKMVADLATRVLHDETTDKDCAYVINSWARKNGFKDAGFTAQDMREIFESVQSTRKETDKVVKEFEDILSEFCKSLESFDDKHNMPKYEGKKPAAMSKKNDPEDVIDNFLKTFGLR